MREATVVCDGLVVGHRDKPVLSATDISFGPGVTAIVGKNGAGKSTLLRTLATLLRPISGAFAVCGHAGTGRGAVKAIRQRLGFVPQSPDFPPSFTIEEMLTYTAAIQRLTGRAAVDDACALFELDTIRRSCIGSISGGQRQRAFLAQATLHKPPVLLLDEPTVGLDIPSRHDFKRYLRTIGALSTVVFTTHLVDDLVGTADDVVVVSASRGVRHLGAIEQMLRECATRGVDLETLIASELN